MNIKSIKKSRKNNTNRLRTDKHIILLTKKLILQKRDSSLAAISFEVICFLGRLGRF